MLDFKRYAVRMVRKTDKEAGFGHYTQWFIEGTDEMDAKRRAREQFGPLWFLEDIFGPFPEIT